MSQDDRIKAPLEKPVARLIEPFQGFASTQTSSSWLLLAATVVSLLVANSPLAGNYADLQHLELGLLLGESGFTLSLHHWVNDGLMALFFFLLGLELKRELLVGRLSDLRSAGSVICAALGGMLLPAAVFLAFADSAAVRSAWAIPMATDTAFALMILLLLGDRVPAVARAFLVGLAIVDDLGAILVIALVYTSGFDAGLLLPVLGVVVTIALMNLMGIRSGWLFFISGVALWWLFLEMGLHGTLAGVVVALLAPVRPAMPRRRFLRLVRNRLKRFEDQHDTEATSILQVPEQHKMADDVLEAAQQASVPLKLWEQRLEGPVSFVVVPLFAFFNAGVVLSAAALTAASQHELTLAIALGLLVGKPAGILLGIWCGRISGLAELPEELSWQHLLGLGLLGAIGFTMALFIATLGFDSDPELLMMSKQAIIVTSLAAGLAGYLWLRWSGAPGRH